ncbi:MAG: T9SS type A sorting domain-containing protein [bacterium]|nr:T9SS type A sorting domain-containing protein [bacterium]
MKHILTFCACSLAAFACTALADPGGPLLTNAGYSCVVPPGIPCPRTTMGLRIYFDEDIDPVTGADETNYTYHPVDDPGAPIPVDEVWSLWGRQALVSLTVLPDTVDYLLTVHGVEDLDGNPMVPQSLVVEPNPDPSTVPDARVPVFMSAAPNPFNPATEVSFVLPAAGKVDLAAYDLSGRRVATIVAGHLEAGRHSRRWNATGLASGSYLLRLRAGGTQTSQKVSLVR